MKMVEYFFDASDWHKYRLLFRIVKTYCDSNRLTIHEFLYDTLFEKLIRIPSAFSYCDALFCDDGGLGISFRQLFERNIGENHGEESHKDLIEIFEVFAGMTDTLKLNIRNNPELTSEFFQTLKKVAKLVLSDEEIKEYQAVDDQGNVMLGRIYGLLYENWDKVGKRNEMYRFLVCLTDMIDWKERDFPGTRMDLLDAICDMLDRLYYRGAFFSERHSRPYRVCTR